MLVTRINSKVLVLILQCYIIKHTNWQLTYAAMVPEAHQNIELEFNLRTVGRLLAQCFGGRETIWQCLGLQFDRALDFAVNDNNTWLIGESLSFDKDNSNGLHYAKLQQLEEERSLGNSIGGKLIQLLKSRTLHAKLPQSSISNAIDEFNQFEQGMRGLFKGIINDKIDRIKIGFGIYSNTQQTKKNKKNKLSKNKKKENYFLNPGRKKKDKDKHMAMMGGMVMIATIAQMFLGKVILIAGSAFIMAKLALLISVLSSLKKGQSTTGHSGKPEHSTVIVGSHSHESGWHRSMPHSYKPPPHHEHHVTLVAASPDIETETEYFTHNSDDDHEGDLRRRHANVFI